MPIEPPEGEMIAVLMPTTSPAMLNSGPPELPRLMAASVWMKSSYGPALMLRLRAETMPSVTEPPSPNGLPIAITQSPTRIVSELPNGTAVSGFAGSGVTFSTARSVSVSRPFTCALRVVPSAKLTSISSASSMTWLLVMMTPWSASSTNPDPSEFTRRDGELRPSG